MKKIVVLFPGIGYTCDKPLLYYSSKLAKEMGYEIRKVEYGGFPANVKGDAEKMTAAVEMALAQAEDLLSDVDWDTQEDILFLSKSVGTIVSSAYACSKKMDVRNVLYTPLAETFRFSQSHSIAFHGTADPWADTDEISRLTMHNKVPLYLTEGANHSLETGNALKDLKELEKVMRITKAFIEE